MGTAAAGRRGGRAGAPRGAGGPAAARGRARAGALDVAVDDAALVAVEGGREHLLDEGRRRLLAVAVAVRLHPRDERAAGAHLHDDVHLALAVVLERLVDPHDVRVVERPLDRDLVAEQLEVVVLEPLDRDRLAREHLAVGFPAHRRHRAARALAEHDARRGVVDLVDLGVVFLVVGDETFGDRVRRLLRHVGEVPSLRGIAGVALMAARTSIDRNVRRRGRWRRIILRATATHVGFVGLRLRSFGPRGCCKSPRRAERSAAIRHGVTTISLRSPTRLLASCAGHSKPPRRRYQPCASLVRGLAFGSWQRATPPPAAPASLQRRRLASGRAARLDSQS